jgi:hypothetical protein
VERAVSVTYDEAVSAAISIAVSVSVDADDRSAACRTARGQLRCT